MLAFRALSTPLRRAAGLALVAGAVLPAAASAGTTIVNDYAVSYDMEVTYEHNQYWGENVADTANVTYKLSGDLGHAIFEDDTLKAPVAAPIDVTTDTTTKTTHTNPLGTSGSCEGGKGTVRGTGNLAMTKGGQLWFAPVIGAEVTAQCSDTDGRNQTSVLRFSAIQGDPPPTGLTDAVPWFGFGFGVGESYDRIGFRTPFAVRAKSRRCPGHDVASTTKCDLLIKGELLFVSIHRTKKKNDRVEIKGVKVTGQPKLDKARTKATTTVRCPRACQVDIGIGVFKPPTRKAPMAPFARKRVKLERGGEKTVTVKLDAADRARIGKSGALAQVSVKVGARTQVGTYPLALPPIPGLDDVPDLER